LSDASSAPAIQPSASAQQGQGRQRAIIVWLAVVIAMVFAMVVLGGVTRLNNAGLSMVEWQPATGWLPPLDEVAWQSAFMKYQQYPEYRHLNVGMTLEEFKFIFWLEFAHRLWGRLMGIVFLVPLLVFAWCGWVDRPLMARLALLFVLGAAQGGMGWYMVMSGLADEPDVSPYRLTAHLALGFLIYGLLLGIALGHGRPGAAAHGTDLPEARRRGIRRVAGALLALVFLTVLAGGFVAGLDAGFTYNTFPLMDGQLIPDGLGEFEPWWRNLAENITTVQFNHRVLAMTTVVTALASWLATRVRGLAPAARLAGNLVLLAALAQAGLGIATLLLVVPVTLAALHQAFALVLFAIALWLVHELRPGSTSAAAAAPAGSLSGTAGAPA